MKITQKQREKLWGKEGPYSEARLTLETRILDDSVSRIFIVVEVSINPLTYEIISKNRKKFMHDPMVLQLIDSAVYRDEGFGYVAQAFSAGHNSLAAKKAEECLEYAKTTIIKMHRFVMDLLEL